MISLCPACHAKVHRTKAVLSRMSPLCSSCGESSIRTVTSKPCWISRREEPPLVKMEWCAVERRWSTAGANPARELDRSTR